MSCHINKTVLLDKLLLLSKILVNDFNPVLGGTRFILFINNLNNFSYYFIGLTKRCRKWTEMYWKQDISDINYFMPKKKKIVQQILVARSTTRTILLKPQEPNSSAHAGFNCCCLWKDWRMEL